MSCSGSVGSWLQRYSLFFSAGRTKKKYCLSFDAFVLIRPIQQRLLPSGAAGILAADANRALRSGLAVFRAVIVARPEFERGHSRVRLITQDGKYRLYFPQGGRFIPRNDIFYGLWNFLTASQWRRHWFVFASCVLLSFEFFFFFKVKVTLWNESFHYYVYFISQTFISLTFMCSWVFPILTLPSPLLSPLYSCFLLCVDYWFLVYKMSPYDIQQSLQ